MLELKLFGPFGLHSSGRPLPRLRSNTGQWLLTLLALRHDAPVERVWLSGTLWPDSTEEQAQYNLRRNLTDLRRVLGPDAGRLQTPTRRTVRLDLSDAACDLLAFDAAMRRATPESLEAAVSLYGGPLLEGCYEEWVLPDRRQREADYLRALETLAAQSAPTTVVGYLRRIVAVDPAQETAQRRLMSALATQGDHAGAARAYTDFRRYLKKDLGAEPDAETAALHRRLQSGARKVPESAPSPAPRIPSRLPQPTTPLIGRERERADVARTLSAACLMTLTGAGGVGKTRLALAAASDVQGAYPDGAWFADLSPLTDPVLVPQAVASALGVAGTERVSHEQALTEHLREQSALLVLDNCEHVREAAARLATGLRRDCPGVHILATSRLPLGLKAEATYRVPSLPAPPEAAPPDTLPGFAAIRLFVDRACAVSPRFTLSPESASHVAHICRRLSGIPLAIELAAARVRALAPAEIAGHLDQQFRLLTGARPGTLRRQQTLRASLDWSWDLLDAQERAALTRLSVFAGSLSLEAAEAVLTAEPIEAWEVLDLLTRLNDWNLITAERDPDGGEERYRLLETVRQYAAEQRRESGDMATNRRHRAFFQALTSAALPNVTGPDGPRWLARLEAEHDDLRAALDDARRDPGAEAAQQGLTLAAALSWFWLVRGHITEGRERLAASLAHPEARGPTHARASALRGSTMLAYRQADFTAARDLSRAAQALFHTLGEVKGEGDALLDQGNIALSTRRLAEARVLYEESKALFLSIGETVRASRAQANIGVAAESQGDLDTAEACYEESLGIARALGDTYSSASNLSSLGTIAFHRGDLPRARALLEEGLTLQRSMGQHDNHLAATLTTLAQTALQQGRAEEAGGRLTEAGTICRDGGICEAGLDILEIWARLHLTSGAHARTARLLGAADAARTALDVPRRVLSHPAFEADLAAAHAALGDAVFRAAWQEGRGLSWQSALDEAARPD